MTSADVGQLARAVGVGLDDVVDAQWADNGPGWVALLLRDAELVLSLTPNARQFEDFPAVGVVGPHPPGADVAFEVRAFVADDGTLYEDPVTGSLNAALGQWLIPADHAPSSYLAAQGTRLGRRGRVHVDRRDDGVWVGGDTVVGIIGRVALGS